MISDVLSDASASIKEYLVHPATAPCYTGPIRSRIDALLVEMDAVRTVLDAPPKLPHQRKKGS